MSKKIDCRVFNDQLENLNRNSLTEDIVQQLFSHAKACPDCAAILRIHDQLAEIPSEVLESSVPDDMVRGMWARVDRATAERTGERSRAPRLFDRPIMKWLVPVQAAAIMVLLVGAGLMYGEFNRLSEREGTLLQRLDAQDDRINRMARSVQSNVYAARTRGLTERRLWQGELAGHDELTVAELNHFLSSLAEDTQLLDFAGAERLLRSVSRGRTGLPDDVLSRIRTEDGLQPEEARALIEAMGFAHGDRVPVRWIDPILKRYKS